MLQVGFCTLALILRVGRLAGAAALPGSEVRSLLRLRLMPE